MLTIESMLQVVDKRTGKKGKQTDVRALLGISPEEIKDQKLRDELISVSLKNNNAKNDSTRGYQNQDFEILKYDTGCFEDETGMDV